MPSLVLDRHPVKSAAQSQLSHAHLASSICRTVTPIKVFLCALTQWHFPRAVRSHSKHKHADYTVNNVIKGVTAGHKFWCWARACKNVARLHPYCRCLSWLMCLDHSEIWVFFSCPQFMNWSALHEQGLKQERSYIGHKATYYNYTPICNCDPKNAANFSTQVGKSFHKCHQCSDMFSRECHIMCNVFQDMLYCTHCVCFDVSQAGPTPTRKVQN